MTRPLSAFCATLICLTAVPAIHADVIAFEDFEDSTLTYTGPADALADIAASDYYGRLGNDNATPPASVVYNNIQGGGYYGVQDTDGALPAPLDVIELNWTGIDISDFENLNLSWLVAEDTAGDSAEDWDTTSSFRIAVQLDGGGYVDVFAVASELGTDGNQTNERPLVDTDFDGIGDGAEITDTFTQFSTALANGTTMDIRVTFEDLNAGDEDFAFDNLLLEGDFVGAIPEPGSAMLFGLALMGLGGVRRRSRKA